MYSHLPPTRVRLRRVSCSAEWDCSPVHALSDLVEVRGSTLNQGIINKDCTNWSKHTHKIYDGSLQLFPPPQGHIRLLYYKVLIGDTNAHGDPWPQPTNDYPNLVFAPQRIRTTCSSDQLIICWPFGERIPFSSKMGLFFFFRRSNS